MARAGSGWPRKGRSDKLVPHAIYHVDAEGAIDQEIALPEALLAQ